MPEKINQRIFMGLKADNGNNVTTALLPQGERLTLSPPFTISLRFYMWEMPECWLVDLSPGFRFSLSGGNLQFRCLGTSGVSSGKRGDKRDLLFKNSFNTADISCDGHTLCLYINGLLSDEAAFSLDGIEVQLTEPLQIKLGGGAGSYLQWFRFYRRCLGKEAILKNLIDEEHDHPDLFMDFTGKECRSTGTVCTNLSCQGNSVPVNVAVCFSPGIEGYAAMLPPCNIYGNDPLSLYVSLLIRNKGSAREILFCSGSKEKEEDWFALVIRYKEPGKAYLDLEVGGGTISGGRELPVEQWFDIGVVLKADSLDTYINGTGDILGKTLVMPKQDLSKLWYFGNYGEKGRGGTKHVLSGYLDTFAVFGSALLQTEFDGFLTSALSADSRDVKVFLQFLEGGMEEMIENYGLLVSRDAGMILCESTTFDETEPAYIPAGCSAKYTPVNDYEKWQIVECAGLYKGFLENTYGISIPSDIVNITEMTVAGGLAVYIASHILPLPQTQQMLNTLADTNLELPDILLETYEEYLEGIQRNGAGRGMWNRTAGGGGHGRQGGYFDRIVETVFGTAGAGAGAGGGFSFTAEGFAVGLTAAGLTVAALSGKRPNKPLPKDPDKRDCSVKSILFAHNPEKPLNSAVYIRKNSREAAVVPEWDSVRNGKENPGTVAYIKNTAMQSWLTVCFVYTGAVCSATLSITCSANEWVDELTAENPVSLTAGENQIKCTVKWKEDCKAGASSSITLGFSFTFADGTICHAGSATVKLYMLERKPLMPWEETSKEKAPTAVMLDFAMEGYTEGLSGAKYMEMLSKSLKKGGRIKASPVSVCTSVDKNGRELKLDLTRLEELLTITEEGTASKTPELGHLDVNVLCMDCCLLLGYSIHIARLRAGAGSIRREWWETAEGGTGTFKYKERDSALFLNFDTGLGGVSLTSDEYLKTLGLMISEDYYLLGLSGDEKKIQYTDCWMKEAELICLSFATPGENGGFSSETETGTIRAKLICGGTSCFITDCYMKLDHQNQSAAGKKMVLSASDEDGICSLSRERLIYFCKSTLEFELHRGTRLPFDSVIDSLMPPSSQTDRCHYISQTTLAYKVAAILNEANKELKSQPAVCAEHLEANMNLLIDAAFVNKSCVGTDAKRFLKGAGIIRDKIKQIYARLAIDQIDDPFALPVSDTIEELANYMAENLNNSIDNLRAGNLGWNRNISDQFDPGSWFSFYEGLVCAYEGGEISPPVDYAAFCQNMRSPGTMPTAVPVSNGIYLDSVADAMRIRNLLLLPMHIHENFGVLDYVAVVDAEGNKLPFHIPASSDNQFTRTNQFVSSLINGRAALFRRNADLAYNGWK